MLNREVEASVFDQTKKWLEQDDAYFFLVLDELHLQRGAAGTEVAYLLRLLLHRLGLTHTSRQRKKIRILSSSASLPASPEGEAEKSAQYLWGHVRTARPATGGGWIKRCMQRPLEKIDPAWARTSRPIFTIR